MVVDKKTPALYSVTQTGITYCPTAGGTPVKTPVLGSIDIATAGDGEEPSGSIVE